MSSNFNAILDIENASFSKREEDWSVPSEVVISKILDMSSSCQEVTENLIKYLATKDDRCLSNVPNHLITENSVKEIAEHSKARIPTQFFLNQEISNYIFFKRSDEYEILDVMQEMPNHFKTKEMCEELDRKGLLRLWVVPDSLKTKELCQKAIKRHTNEMSGIPHHFQDAEMIKEIQKTKRNASLAYCNIRSDLFTPELALKAVKESCWNLEHVPAHCQTQEVIEAALKQDPMAECYIKVKGLMMEALGEALDE